MIRDELPAGVFESLRLAEQVWKLERRISGRHTDLLVFRGVRNDDRIFIKRLHESRCDGTDRRLRREFRALRVLQCRLGPEMLDSLPAPLGAHQDDSVLVVSGVRGYPLSRLLKRDANLLTGLLRTQRLRATGSAVGTWLRQFHAATARTPAAHDHERFCRGLAAALNQIAAKSGTEGLSDISDRLMRASAGLAGSPLGTAACHGDFLPQNILIRNDSAAVVDFESYRVRDVVHCDIGSMLAYTMMLEGQPGYLRGALRAFGEAFKRSYGEEAEADVQRLFTAAGAVWIARDSSHPRVRSIMLKTVAALVPGRDQGPQTKPHDE